VNDLAELLDLIRRAMYDLEHDWPAAAYDALGRAERIAKAVQERPHG
jgi:hypothetical protein